VGLAGKKHVGPPKSFPFERIKGLEESCVAVTARYDEQGLTEFMTRDPSQPFGLVVPHCPWTVGKPEHFPPAQIKLPPQIADTKETRKDLAKYLN